MGMIPQIYAGVFSQRAWPGVGPGPLDDCWVMADLMAIHACAPWSYLMGVPAYRAAAGVPDTATGSEGGSLEASLKAITKLWPALVATTTLYRGSWQGFVAEINKGGPFSASVLSGSLPQNYGFAGNHRIMGCAVQGAIAILNPLADPHSHFTTITYAQLQKALADYPSPAEANAILFPTVEQAFITHPLFVAPAQPPVSTTLGPGIYEVK